MMRSTVRLCRVAQSLVKSSLQRSALSVLPSAVAPSLLLTHRFEEWYTAPRQAQWAGFRHMSCSYSAYLQSAATNSVQGLLHNATTSVEEDSSDDDSYDDNSCDDSSDADSCDEEEEQAYSSDEEEEECYEVHHVQQRLPLKAVALGDDGDYVIPYEGGATAWSLSRSSGGLISSLKLAGKYNRNVAAVSMGRNQGSDTYSTSEDPGEVWFLKRDTGTTYMGDGCDEDLVAEWDAGEGDDFVAKVCFAPSDGWFVFRRGGGAKWQGLPSSLDATLDEEWDKAGGVKTLSVGHSGEWFVMFKDGSYWWCSVHPFLAELLKSKQAMTGSVEWVELGPDGAFVALFERYTAWYGSKDLTNELLR